MRMLDWNQLGFILHACADHAHAVSFIEKQRFSLVVINFKRFHDEGLQLCAHIRQTSRTAVLLLGGDHDFNLARKALTYHVSDYLADPVHASDLSASLKTIKRQLDAETAALSPIHAVIQQNRHRPSSIIETVKKYVQEELHRNITLKKISDALHFNCAYLGQKFKNEEKMSFNAYLLQQRMEKAKRLLEQTDMRIYEIAKEVGYTETDWFYKKFKAYTGTSANEYRKRISITA